MFCRGVILTGQAFQREEGGMGRSVPSSKQPNLLLTVLYSSLGVESQMTRQKMKVSFDVQVCFGALCCPCNLVRDHLY